MGARANKNRRAALEKEATLEPGSEKWRVRTLETDSCDSARLTKATIASCMNAVTNRLHQRLDNTVRSLCASHLK